MSFRDFFGREAGQQRRAWLDDTVNEGLRYLLGPTGVDDKLHALGITDPRNIRSRFARFDPRLAHLRNLSAGLAGTGILAPTLMQDDQR